MTLGAAFQENSPLVHMVRQGLDAVKRRDRALIAQAERGKIGDSLDLDEATREDSPGEHRWDYILSVPSASRLIGLEPHTAADAEVKVVIKKKTNAVRILREHLKPGIAISEWHWVTSGKVGFSRMDRATRALNQNGITFSGRLLRRVDG